MTRTGEARADEGETEGSVSDGMRTSETRREDTSRREGHESGRAVALIAGRRTRERTLTGKVNTGEGKDAGRERDETGLETQGDTRGENGGRRERGGGPSGPTRGRGRRSVTTNEGGAGETRWRERERNAKRGHRGEAAGRESRQGDLMNGDVRGGKRATPPTRNTPPNARSGNRGKRIAEGGEKGGACSSSGGGGYPVWEFAQKHAVDGERVRTP
mmetsp:Transcript_6789/g.8911  ORF Transcript_6789/g.8911 Transcript_6789/m.8911 type:complete len:216 (-) Transcript_6789:169-816(-)